jgi:uncharacterized protein (TIRG00374 family)
VVLYNKGDARKRIGHGTGPRSQNMGGSEGGKHRTRFVLGAVLSLAGLVLTFRNVHFPGLFAALAGADYALVTTALAVNLLAFGATAMRWQILFYPHKTPKFSQLFSGLMVAQLANTALPAHLGIVARAYWIGEVGEVSKTFALGTIVLEKVVEGITLLPFLVLLPLLYPFPSGVQQAGWTLGVALAALGLVMVLLNRYKEGLSRFLVASLSSFPSLGPLRLAEHLTSVIEGFDALRVKEAWAPIWGWSVGIWTTIALSYYLALRAFHIQVPLLATLLLLIVLQVGARVPALPSGIGVFHYLVVLTLSPFLVDRDLAVSYALVLHGMIFLIPSLLGVFCLWRAHWGLGYLRDLEAVPESGSSDG